MRCSAQCCPLLVALNQCSVILLKSVFEVVVFLFRSRYVAVRALAELVTRTLSSLWDFVGYLRLIFSSDCKIENANEH